MKWGSVKNSFLYDFLGKRSFSQCGEDLVAMNLLGREKGVYVDVGAYHPKVFSNTYLFYKKGWSGVIVEPNDELIGLYRDSRPKDILVRAGVAREPDVKKYFVFEDGACNTFDKGKMEEYKKVGRKLLDEKMIEVLPLNKILDGRRIKKIDLLSVDVEGMDLEVLKTMDWEKWKPKVVIAEDMEINPEKPLESEVVKYLKKQGYKLISITPFSLIFKYKEE